MMNVITIVIIVVVAAIIIVCIIISIIIAIITISIIIIDVIFSTWITGSFYDTECKSYSTPCFRISSQECRCDKYLYGHPWS